MTLEVPLTVRPMEAVSVDDLPTGKVWLFEPKYDGFRTILFRDGDSVNLQSRRQRPLGRYFPEIIEAAHRLPIKQFVFDGELIIPDQPFDTLQLRLHPAADDGKRNALGDHGDHEPRGDTRGKARVEDRRNDCCCDCGDSFRRLGHRVGGGRRARRLSAGAGGAPRGQPASGLGSLASRCRDRDPVRSPVSRLGEAHADPEVGWSSHDPLLLVGPLVALALVYRLFFVERRQFAPERFSMLVGALLCLTFLETFNPWGAGLGVNAVGLLFVGAPLLWFFIGRELASERIVMRFGAWVIVSGALIALYGLHQTQAGLFSWDSEWVRVGGYKALAVGEVTRAFGTFSSAAEYAQYIGAAGITAVVLAIHRKGWALLAIPLLATAIFLASVRTTLILAVVALIVVMIFRFVRRPAWAATASVLVVLSGGRVDAGGSPRSRGACAPVAKRPG